MHENARYPRRNKLDASTRVVIHVANRGCCIPYLSGRAPALSVGDDYASVVQAKMMPTRWRRGAGLGSAGPRASHGAGGRGNAQGAGPTILRDGALTMTACRGVLGRRWGGVCVAACKRCDTGLQRIFPAHPGPAGACKQQGTVAPCMSLMWIFCMGFLID